jgi:hypothetical protein
MYTRLSIFLRSFPKILGKHASGVVVERCGGGQATAEFGIVPAKCSFEARLQRTLGVFLVRRTEGHPGDPRVSA